MRSHLDSLAAGFLIAAPMLRDPNFDHTVVLICMHNEQGAMGLVINRPAPVHTRELLRQIDIEVKAESFEDRAVMIGGPVALESGILLYESACGQELKEDELSVAGPLRLCPSQAILHTIAAGEGPARFHIFLGHAGWGPGQLEQEIARGAWIPADLRLDLIFDLPVEQRWEDALIGEGLQPASLATFRPTN